MSKQEFMEELEVLLGELPKEEREEAIRYYDAYFEDAGAENEQAVIAELGSAGRVAAQILKDFRAEKESGVYTEKGYQEAEEKKETPVRYEEKNTDSNSHREATTDGSGIHIQKKGMSGTTLVLLLIVAVFAFPVWFPLLMAVLGGWPRIRRQFLGRHGVWLRRSRGSLCRGRSHYIFYGVREACGCTDCRTCFSGDCLTGIRTRLSVTCSCGSMC